MRKAFVSQLIELAERDSRVVLLSADLGYLVLEPFIEKFPARFINVGVAEQNMVGVATGMAEAGFIPFVYSIVTFATLRPYEFIRNGPILHRLAVRIVGVGGGLEYAHDGASHYGLEDVGVFRLQPGITVIAPADYQQARTALAKTWDLTGPIYYRLSKDDKTLISGLEGRFELGRIEVVREGADLLVLTMGAITAEAVAAAETLSKKGADCTVGIVSTLNPAPEEELKKLLERFSRVLTVESHYAVGGLGSLVAETIARRGLSCQLTQSAVKDLPDGRSGDHDYALSRHGLSRDKLMKTIQLLLSEKAAEK
ncbi:MAG: transketolase C-terminal domain-containing protein [bacterium]